MPLHSTDSSSTLQLHSTSLRPSSIQSQEYQMWYILVHPLRFITVLFLVELTPLQATQLYSGLLYSVMASLLHYRGCSDYNHCIENCQFMNLICFPLACSSPYCDYDSREVYARGSKEGQSKVSMRKSTQGRLAQSLEVWSSSSSSSSSSMISPSQLVTPWYKNYTGVGTACPKFPSPIDRSVFQSKTQDTNQTKTKWE